MMFRASKADMGLGDPLGRLFNRTTAQLPGHVISCSILYWSFCLPAAWGQGSGREGLDAVCLELYTREETVMKISEEGI